MWRRLPSLLYRRFPNLQDLKARSTWTFPTPADLEVGDTAGLETCATVDAFEIFITLHKDFGADSNRG